MKVRITSKLLGEWEGDLDELLAANPDLDPELATSLGEGESIDFLSSERFQLTRVGEPRVLQAGRFTLRNLAKHSSWVDECSYRYTFECFVDGAWTKFGSAPGTTFSEAVTCEQCSRRTLLSIQLGWDKLDQFFKEHVAGGENP